MHGRRQANSRNLDTGGGTGRRQQRRTTRISWAYARSSPPRIGCEKIPPEIFDWPFADFEAKASGLFRAKLQEVREFRIPLPTHIDLLRPATANYLIGTYRTYRYSFLEEPARIVTEAMIIREGSDKDALDVVLLGHPVIAEPLRPEDSDNMVHNPERFVGSLCKFGKAVYIHAGYFNPDNVDRRMRSLQFPILEESSNRTLRPHHGLFRKSPRACGLAHYCRKSRSKAAFG